MYYLRHCRPTGFECSANNPIFPISPFIFIARNSIPQWFLATHIPRYRRNDYFDHPFFQNIIWPGLGLISRVPDARGLTLLLTAKKLLEVFLWASRRPFRSVMKSYHFRSLKRGEASRLGSQNGKFGLLHSEMFSLFFSLWNQPRRREQFGTVTSTLQTS
jgi:hypothetical protein